MPLSGEPFDLSSFVRLGYHRFPDKSKTRPNGAQKTLESIDYKHHSFYRVLKKGILPPMQLSNRARHGVIPTSCVRFLHRGALSSAAWRCFANLMSPIDAFKLPTESAKPHARLMRFNHEPVPLCAIMHWSSLSRRNKGAWQPVSPSGSATDSITGRPCWFGADATRPCLRANEP
jgi:hypothetical protein